MELTTSWMEQGLQQGLQQGIQMGIQQGVQQGIQMGEAQGQRKEAANLALRLLRRRFGAALALPQPQIERLTLEQLEDLSEALLDFTDPGDVARWLAQQP